MRAVAYIRVSTEEQSGPGHVSLEVQEQRCRDYIASRGWTLIGVERDIESGLKPTRAGYQRVIELARAGSIDAVVVMQASRFGRKASEVLLRVEELRSLNVELVSTAEDLTSFLMLGIQAVLNEHETRVILSRTMPAKQQRTRDGYWLAKAPFGTVNVRGVLQPGPHFDLIRLAFQLAADGENVADITRRINEAIAPRTMHYGNVIKLLKNKAFVSVVQWGGITAPAQWDPLIDPELFNRANAAIRARYVQRRQLSRSYPYWILGLAFCARCGHRMHPKVHVTSWGPGVYPYLICGRVEMRGLERPCRGKYVSILDVQAWVLERVEQQTADAGDVARYIARIQERAEEQAAAEDERRRSLRAERSRLEARLQAAKSAHLDAPDTFTIADVRRIDAAVRDSVAAIDRELAVPVPSVRGEQEIRELRQFFEERAWLGLRDTDPQAFRALLQVYIERVDVRGPGAYELVWRDVFAEALTHSRS